MALSPDPQDDYVSDIASIRAEIRALQTRKRFLSSSLLSSDSLQRHLAPGSAAATRQITDASPLLQTASAHAQTNQHRIAFSTTTFPFSDPAPSQNRKNGEGGKLLGVRIDVCARNGRFVRPYYVLLRKVGGGQDETTKRVMVHRHTIPAFIPMQRLERVYLPSSSSLSSAEDQGDEGNLKPWKTKPQNLPGFIRVLRRNLTSWHLRRDAIIHLREKLGARPPEEGTHPEDNNTRAGASEKDWPLPVNDVGLVSLGPTSLEARYIRLEWDDGRVGRFKVSDSGRVERAVVIGDRGRDKALEGTLTGGDGRVEGVIQRLNGL